jgi:hypothetical protein
MSILHLNGRSLGPSALFALAIVAGCSDGGTGPSDSQSVSFKAAKPIKVLSVPVPADVVVPGAAVGAFVNAIVANNSGRATTEFWDNFSADNIPGGTQSCNVGFYASGTMGAACDNQAVGSLANQGGGYDKYWGDGVGNRDASSFMFNGDFSYNVVLKGSYAGRASEEVGWFTKTGGVYTFHAIAGWGLRTVGTSATINTGGADWGFYIRNTINPDGGGCDPNLTDCSDAEGGFTAIQFQQFALFLNSGTNTYLVGTEDNELELLPPDRATTMDSDYNDFIFSVEPTAEELLDGRMTGGGAKVLNNAGLPVTFGLTLHCDILLSNNLEINWDGGNNWHLDKPITFAACSDNPNIAPKPPAAPFDTFDGEGLGSFNGTPGYKVVFRFVDAGEPGSDDQAAITIYAPDGVTKVLEVPLQKLNVGNLQAHYDQPHGQQP